MGGEGDVNWKPNFSGLREEDDLGVKLGKLGSGQGQPGPDPQKIDQLGLAKFRYR